MIRFFSCLILLSTLPGFAQEYTLRSPNKKIEVRLETGASTRYSVFVSGNQVLSPSEIGLETNLGFLGRNARKTRAKSFSIRDTLISPVPEKRKRIPDICNGLILEFSSRYSLEFRAYDDGVAYRFLTRFSDSLTVVQELAEYIFPNNPVVYYPETIKREGLDIFHTSFEEPYQRNTLDSIPEGTLAFSPVLVSPRMVLTESDLENYPGMFLQKKSGNKLTGAWAPYPLREEILDGEFPQKVVRDRAGFIAKTAGSRSFPWRVMAIGYEDRDLPNNDLVYRLASPSRLKNTDWIQPGKGTDEWIIGINLFNVPFKAGVNTETYKFYIDFASRFGFDRIMMDAGWSNYKDLFDINPEIDMEAIAEYAREKGIRLSLWTLALTLEKQLEPALDQFKKWGVDFIMTDFMDRDDQLMMDFYHRIAKACADKEIMVMFHGAFKPAGFNRTYPNAVTREGVLGSEYNIWSEKATPDHNLLLPFIRMVSGPMDYEPGILDNATRETFRPIGNKVMAMGTRCHQLAMFVVYESPIQIFSGNPSVGLQEPAFMEILGSTPTTWDETLIPDARIGEYIVTARRKGKEWFVGGMSNWMPRDITLHFDFLAPGNYELTICRDGLNADRYPSDYILEKRTLRAGDQLPLHLAPGGGFWIQIKPV